MYQVRRAAEKILLSRKNSELADALDQRFGIHGIIGQSAAMQRILQLIAEGKSSAEVAANAM